MADAKAAILQLLDQRSSGKTICPSEAARLLAGPQSNWREHMDEVHVAVDALLAQQSIALSWKGVPKSQRRGPYRIARR